MSFADQYYLFDRGVQSGPLSRAELDQRFRSGLLDAGALAIPVGGTNWRPVAEVLSTSEASAGAPPPLPPLELPTGSNVLPPPSADTVERWHQKRAQQPSYVADFDPKSIVWKRVFAYFIDWISISAVTCCLTIPMMIAVGVDFQALAQGGAPPTGAGGAETAANCFSTLVSVALLLCRDAFGGRSPGKALLGLRVVDATSGEPIGFGQSIRRNVLLIVCCMPLIFMVLLLINGEHWGDKLGNTRVVPA